MSYVYIVQFDSGLLKVGRTSKPKDRIACHKGNVYSISRSEIVNQWVSIHHTNPDENERSLIYFCQSIAGKAEKRSEWFTGVNFHDVVDHANSLFYDQSPRIISSPEILDSKLDMVFGCITERRKISLSYDCADRLQSFVLDSLWIGGAVFAENAKYGMSPFVIVVGAYFASGDPIGMLVESMADICADPEKEAEAVYGLFDRAAEYARGAMQ